MRDLGSSLPSQSQRGAVIGKRLGILIPLEFQGWAGSVGFGPFSSLFRQLVLSQAGISTQLPGTAGLPASVGATRVYCANVSAGPLGSLGSSPGSPRRGRVQVKLIPLHGSVLSTDQRQEVPAEQSECQGQS